MKSKILPLLVAFCLAPAVVSAFVPEGQQAPQVSMKLLKDGAETDFPGWQAYKGEVVVLEFWATWCEGCVANIPHMDDLAKAFAGRPVVFISATSDDAATVEKFMKDHAMAGYVAVDAKSAGKAFGVSDIPQTVVLDKDGKVLRYTYPDMLSEDGLALLLSSGSADGIPAVKPGPSGKKDETKDVSADNALYSVMVTSAPEKEETTYGYGTSDNSVSLDYHNLDLGALLALVYDLNKAQVEVSTSLPAARYDFKVQGPRNARDALVPLLQQAIRTVYGADIRLVKKDLPVLLLKYDITAPQPGLWPSSVHNPLSYGDGFFRSAGAGMQELASFLGNDLGQPVLDETGMKGLYDIKLNWKGDQEELKAALNAQLGIRLEPATRSIDVLEAVPSDKPAAQ